MRKFLDSPMGMKAVTAVPGIGERIGTRLENLGIEEARDLYCFWQKFGDDSLKSLIWFCNGNSWKDEVCSAMNKKRISEKMRISDSRLNKIVENIETKTPVCNVRGINWSVEQKLQKEHDISTVQELYDYYKKKGQNKLKELIEECGGSPKQQRQVYETLKRRKDRLEDCEEKEKILANRLRHQLKRGCEGSCQAIELYYEQYTYYFYT